MSEAPAPAAPTAASPSTPSNGASAGAAQAPAAKAAPRSSPAVTTKPTLGRSNGGQFLSKDGTVGAAEGEGKPGQASAQPAQTSAEKVAAAKRAYNLKVFGQEEKLELDDAEVTRELQRKRMLEKKLPKLEENDAKARRVLELAMSNPEAFLRELGQDPDEYARKRLAEQARLGSMTEEERAIDERDRKIAELEGREKTRLEAEKKQAAEARHERMVSGFKQKLAPAIEVLKAQGLPEDNDTLAALVETMKLTLEPGVALADVTPEELAADTLKRLDAGAQRYLGRLDTPGLIKALGPARIEALLQHTLAEFEKSQSFESTPRQASAPPAPRHERERVDERELERRLQGLRTGGRR